MQKRKLLISLALLLALVGCHPQENSSTSFDSSPSASVSTSPVSPSESSKPITSSPSSSSSKPSSDSSVTGKAEWPEEIKQAIALHCGGADIPCYKSLRGLGDYEWNYGINSYDEYGHLTIYTLNNIASPSDKFLDGLKDFYTLQGYTLVSSTSDAIVFIQDNITLRFLITDVLTLEISYDEPFDATAATGSWESDFESKVSTNFNGFSLPYFYLGTKHNYAYQVNPSYFTLLGGKWDDSLVDLATTAFSGATKTVNSDGSVLFEFVNATNADVIKLTLSKVGSDKPHAQLYGTFRKGFYPEEATDWTQSVRDEIVKDMHHEVPFVYLGMKEPSYSYDSNSMRLFLSGGSYDDKFISLAKATYTTDGTWEIVEGENALGKNLQMSKYFPEGDSIVINLSGTSTVEDQNICRMTLAYSPIITPAATAWVDATKTAMNEVISHEVPYLYLNLGADSEVVASKVKDKRQFLSLRGGKWNRNIFKLAEKTYTAADGWMNSYDTDGSFASTKTYEDGDIVEVRIPRQNYNTDDLYFNISKWDKFDSSSRTAYDVSVITELTSHFNLHTLPFFYLGAKKEETSFNSTSNSLYIYGSRDDSSLDEAFTTAFTTTTADEDGFTYSVDSKTVEEDGVTYKMATGVNYSSQEVKVGFARNEYGTPYLRVQYFESFDPTTATGTWGEENIATMKSVWGGENTSVTLPYFYTGTTTPKASYNSTTGAITIEGGSYNEQVLTLAKTALTQASFEDISTFTGNYSNILSAYKTFEEGTLRVFVSRPSSNNNAKTTVTAYFDKKLDKATNAANLDTAAWNEETLGKMSANLDGFTLPYMPVPVQPDTFSVSQGTLSMQGSGTGALYASNFNYILKAKEAIENGAGNDYTIQESSLVLDDDKTVSSSKSAYFATLERTGDHSLIRIRYGYKPYGSGFSIYATRYDAFSAPASGSWSMTMEEDFANAGFSLPYFYLGTMYPKYSPYSYVYHEASIQGGTWDDSLFTSVKKTLDDNGFTTFYSYASGYGKSLVGTKADSDGGKTLSVELKRIYQSSNNTVYPTLSIVYR